MGSSIMVEVTCGKCNRVWDYKGKNEYYACCPQCHKSNSLKKIIAVAEVAEVEEVVSSKEEDEEAYAHAGFPLILEPKKTAPVVEPKKLTWKERKLLREQNNVE